MSLKVYFDLMSQPSRALVLFMKLAKIPYEACPVALRKGEHFSDDFGKINPFKKVPAIDHNGFKLAESVAIFRYLAREFPVDDHWYPRESHAQAKVDEYLEWQHNNTRMFGSMYFQTKFLIPLMTQKPVNEKSLARYEKGLETSLDTIDSVFLKENQYLAGNEVSVADLLCACELEQPISVGYDVVGNRDRLRAWLDRVRGCLQPEYDEAHKFIRRVNAAASAKNKL